MKAVLLHPYENTSGNLLWSGTLPPATEPKLPAALALLRERGYWASPFPEGDGVTFNKDDYDPDIALKDFRECFSFMEISARTEGVKLNDQLAEMAGDRAVLCRTLVPVEGLWLIEPLKIGATRLHPPVDAAQTRLRDHPWGLHLCDEAGADMNPDWMPGDGATGTTALLRYPLIERRVPVPASLLHRAGSSIADEKRLLSIVIDDADHALDPLRYTLCHFERLEHLPNKAGWVGDFAEAYLMPDERSFEHRHLAAKPSVLRVSNNWLGLEVGPHTIDGAAGAIAAFVDGKRSDEIGLEIKSALRALGKAFYLVDLEAAFLHLVYALDALSEPGSLTGIRHRIWVCACASGGNAACFEELLKKHIFAYGVRNDIVHKGKSFAEIGESGPQMAQSVQRMFGLTIDDLIKIKATSRQEVFHTMLDRLRSPKFEAIVAAHDANAPRLPIDDDKVFKRIIERGSTL